MTTVTVVTDKCDRCGKEFSHEPGLTCPSEMPVMNISVGYHRTQMHVTNNLPETDKISLSSRWLTRVGYDLGDMCKYCQEELIKLLLQFQPNAKEVIFND